MISSPILSALFQEDIDLAKFASAAIPADALVVTRPEWFHPIPALSGHQTLASGRELRNRPWDLFWLTAWNLPSRQKVAEARSIFSCEYQLQRDHFLIVRNLDPIHSCPLDASYEKIFSNTTWGVYRKMNVDR